jgi:hypothetical protein
MTGYLADVLTDSSMRSSRSILVEACSMTEDGVVNTMRRQVEEGGDLLLLLLVLKLEIATAGE